MMSSSDYSNQLGPSGSSSGSAPASASHPNGTAYIPVSLAEALQRTGNDSRRALEEILAERNHLVHEVTKLTSENVRIWNLMGKIRRENESLKEASAAGSANSSRGPPLSGVTTSTVPAYRSQFEVPGLQGSPSSAAAQTPNTSLGLTPKSRQYASAEAATSSPLVMAAHSNLAIAVGMHPSSGSNSADSSASRTAPDTGSATAAAAAAARAQNIMQQRMAAQAQAQAIGGASLAGLSSSVGASNAAGAAGAAAGQQHHLGVGSSNAAQSRGAVGLAPGVDHAAGRYSSESVGDSFHAVDDSDNGHGGSTTRADGIDPLAPIHSALGLSDQATPPLQQQSQQQQQQQQQHTPQQNIANMSTPRNMTGVGAGGATSSPRNLPQQLPVSPRARVAGLPSDHYQSHQQLQHGHHRHGAHHDSPKSSAATAHSAQAQASALLQAAAGIASTSVASPGGDATTANGRAHARQKTQDIGNAIAQAAFLSSSSTAPRLDAATLTNNTAVHVPVSRLRSVERGREATYFEISVTILIAPAHWGPPPPSNAQGVLAGDFPPMKWSVEKTLSDLAGLDARLRQKHGKSAMKKLMAELPEQSLFVDHAPSRVDQRKIVVETYLQKLLKLPLPDKDDICTFFCTDVVRPRPVDPNSLAKEGFLTKKGLNPGRWVTRYYCLRTPSSAPSAKESGSSGKQGSALFDKHTFRLDYFEYQGGPQIGTINIAGAEIGRQQRNSASDMDENSYRHAFLILERRPVATSTGGSGGASNGELAASGTMNSLASGTGSNSQGGGTSNSGGNSGSNSAMQTVRHVLCAENDRERDEWVDVLVRAIDAAHRDANTSSSSKPGPTAGQQSQQPSSSTGPPAGTLDGGSGSYLQPAANLGGNTSSPSYASHPGSPQVNNAMALPSLGQSPYSDQLTQQKQAQQQIGLTNPLNVNLPASSAAYDVQSPVGSSASSGPAHHPWAAPGQPAAGGAPRRHGVSVADPGSSGHGYAHGHGQTPGYGHGKNAPSSSSTGPFAGTYGPGVTYSPRGVGANAVLPSDSGPGHSGYSHSHGPAGGGYGGHDTAGSGVAARTAGSVPLQARSMSTDATANVGPGAGNFGQGSLGGANGTSPSNTGHDASVSSTNATSVTSTSQTSTSAPAGASSSPFRTNKAAISGPMNGTPIPQGYKFGGNSTASNARAGGAGLEDEVEKKEKDSEKKRFWQGFRGFGSSDKSGQGHGHGRGGGQQDATTRAVFGVQLADAIAVSSVGEGLGLPSVVYRCIEFLERRGAYKEEGIYRLSGSSAVIKSLKDKFNAAGDVDLLAPGTDYYDPHAVAGLLKTFLRELPESVLTRELHFEFLRVNEMPERRDRVRELGRLVCMLPLANYSVLRTLCSHLIKIIQHSDVNKMTMRNVGIVFSPTLAIPAGVFALFLTEFDYVFFTDATGVRAPMTIEDEEAAEAAAAAAAAAAQQQLNPLPSSNPGPTTSSSANGSGNGSNAGLMAPAPRKAGRNPNRGSWIAGTTLHSGGDGATHQLAMQMAAAQEAASMPSPQQAQAAIAAAAASGTSERNSGGASLGVTPSGQRSNRNSLSYNEADAERLLGLGGGQNGHRLVGHSPQDISAAEEELGAMSTALMASSGAGSAALAASPTDGPGSTGVLSSGMVAPPVGGSASGSGGAGESR